jgi:hypothetical protein
MVHNVVAEPRFLRLPSARPPWLVAYGCYESTRTYLRCIEALAKSVYQNLFSDLRLPRCLIVQQILRPSLLPLPLCPA